MTPYTARSLSGAQARVRQQEQQIGELKAEAERWRASAGTLMESAERWKQIAQEMAKLASDKPGRLLDRHDTIAAKKLRDRILAEMGLRPDGGAK